MREQWRWIEAFCLHHRHQSPHPFFASRAKCGHDFVIANAGCKRVVRHLEFARIHAKAAERSARVQATQAILKRSLNTQRFDCNVRAAPRVSFFISLRRSASCGSSTTSAPVRWDIFIRTGSLSTATMNEAPINFAPAVAHKPIGRSPRSAVK